MITLFTSSNFILQLNTWGYSPYVTSYLTRERVCRLQLMLVLASAVILRSDSSKIHKPIPDSPNLEDQVPYLYPPWTRWCCYTPQALGSLFVASFDSQGYGGPPASLRIYSPVCTAYPWNSFDAWPYLCKLFVVTKIYLLYCWLLSNGGPTVACVLSRMCFPICFRGYLIVEPLPSKYTSAWMDMGSSHGGLYALYTQPMYSWWHTVFIYSSISIYN
jgi:hypothetical protein